MTAVADTSVLVAVINRRDNDHAPCAAALRKHLESGVIVTAVVAVEVDYLVGQRAGQDPLAPSSTTWTAAPAPPAPVRVPDVLGLATGDDVCLVQ